MLRIPRSGTPVQYGWSEEAKRLNEAIYTLLADVHFSLWFL